jgi:BirA family transcriptional regulator, biotin operon repressor / biotin---[acetyl-CoA-carboxylase] ligase
MTYGVTVFPYSAPMPRPLLPPFRVLHHGVVDSTNERALATIAAGTALHGDVHVARGQGAGRGRRGARWESAEGQGLYASLVLMPEPPEPPAPGVTMLAGLGLLDALRALGLSRARLKWPNDVMVGEAKLGGCLVETRGFQPEEPHFVVGFGLNVAQRDFPPALAAERSVTSLALERVETNPMLALEALLAALPLRWQQLVLRSAEQAGDYLTAADLTGRVRVDGPDGSLTGRILSLDARIGLRLALDHGGDERIPVEHVRAVARA